MRRYEDDPRELHHLRRPTDAEANAQTRPGVDPHAAIVARLQQSVGNHQTQRILAASRAVQPRRPAGRKLQRLIKSVDIHDETAKKALFWLSQGKDPRTAPMIESVTPEVATVARQFAE